MGIVYHARDPIINRRVALKTITTGLAENPGLLERFYREAQSAGGLQHPNIVTIYDMGEASGIPYIAMEFIEGESLEIIIAREDKLPIPLKLSYAMQACRALDYAHKRGIVHRDIKPANLMVNKEGVVKVVDFGIARVLEASKTQTGMLIGTFAYMSPEQYEGMHADERSDIWSFGVLLYELLAGKRPFSGATPASVMHSICHADPQPLSAHVPDCPAELQTLMNRILMKSPVDRYQSMEDLLLDLDPIFKSLQAATVSQRVAAAGRLFDAGDFSAARDLLKQTLQIDSANAPARALLERVNSELKRMLVRPRAQEHVDRGSALLAEGKIQEAKVEAQASLHLDSRFEPALNLQKRVEEELERWQLIAELLENTRQKLAEGAPEQAEESLAKLLKIDPKNRDAQALQEQAAKERSVRDRRLYMLQMLQQARSRWTQQDYAQCIQILQALQKEFPQEEEITRLLETAREDQAEQQKRQNLAKARELLAANKYADCKHLLSQLSRQFPQDTHVSALLHECATEEQNQIRRQGLKQARTLLAARRYDECLAQIEALRKDFPEDDEIKRLSESLEGARKDEHLSRELAAVRELLAVRKYAECSAALESLAREFPGNQDVANLQTVLQQEQAEQRRLAGLAEARKMFVAKRHEDAITLLTKLQAEFPDDRDRQISKLLQSARAGLAEQQKEKKLGEARTLLAGEKFAEAKALLDELHHLHPEDTGVQKLQRLATSEEEGRAKRKRLQQQWDELRQLASQKNYAEAVARTEKLLAEFPGEADLKRFLEFAKSHQAQAERETRLKEILAEVKRLVGSSRWPEAVKACKSGLDEFPGNPELLSSFEHAQTELRKQQTKRSIEQRMRDIKVKINREKFSEAVELAKETLATFGPDTDVTQLLNSAEVELQARNKKRKTQDAKLESVQRLIRDRKLDEATATLAAAIDAAILEPSDHRVAQAWSEIKTQGTVQPAAPVAPSAPPNLAKEYALLQGPPVEPEPTIAEPEMQAAATPAVPVSTGSTANTEIAPTIEDRPEAVAREEVRSEAQTVALPAEAPVTIPVQPPRIPAVPRERPAAPPPIEPKPSRRMPKGPIAAAAAVVLAIVIWAGIHFSSHNETTSSAPPATKTAAVQPPAPPRENPIELEQKNDLAEADKKVAADDLEGAIAILQKGAALNGPLTSAIQQKQAGLEAALKDAGLRKIRQNEEQLWQQGTADVDKTNFRDAESKFRKILALPQGATLKDKAKDYLDNVIPQRKQEEKLFAAAQKGASSNDAGALQTASQLADQVIALGGPRKSGAEQLKTQIAARLTNIADANKQAQQQRTAQQIADLQLGARASMKAGDFTSARRQAGQIKQLGADSSALSSEIEQAEKMHSADSAYQSAVQRYRQANASDQNALQSARQNFQSIAEGGGPHANDARNYVNEISQKLAKLTAPPTPAAPAPTSVSTADTDAIKALLDRYAQAFGNRDAEAVREVWPSMSSKIYNGYKNAFQNASAINLQINKSDIAFAPDHSTATVNAMVTQDYTPKKQAMKSITTPYAFQFSKKNGNWVITAVK